MIDSTSFKGVIAKNYPEKGRFLRELRFDFDAFCTECVFRHHKYTLVTAIHYDGQFVRKLSPFSCTAYEHDVFNELLLILE